MNLEKLHWATKEIHDISDCAHYYADKIIPAMAETRAVADQIEALTGEGYKPFPSYGDLLFRV